MAYHIFQLQLLNIILMLPDLVHSSTLPPHPPWSHVPMFPLGTLDGGLKQSFCPPRGKHTNKPSGQQSVFAVFSSVATIFWSSSGSSTSLLVSRRSWSSPWTMAASCLIPSNLLNVVRLLCHASHVLPVSVHAAWQQDLGITPSLLGACFVRCSETAT